MASSISPDRITCTTGAGVEVGLGGKVGVAGLGMGVALVKTIVDVAFAKMAVDAANLGADVVVGDFNTVGDSAGLRSAGIGLTGTSPPAQISQATLTKPTSAAPHKRGDRWLIALSKPSLPKWFVGYF
jgi:hypothetical protein